MKVVTVIPIHRGVFRDRLTYFSAQTVESGDLVSVPVRRKMINAVVWKTEPVEQVKTELRQADFGMKKIGGIKQRRFLPPELLVVATQLADYHAAPLGLILKSMLPKVMLESGEKSRSNTSHSDSKIANEKLVLQDSDEERLSYYKSLTREAFARQQSIFICEPTVAEIQAVRPILERGIAHYTLELHGQLGIKTLHEAWRAALENPHPLLIIGTPIFLVLPRSDLTTIILDREGALSYRAQSRPFLDYRRLAEWLANERGSRLILGDILLRPETMWRTERGEFTPVRAPKQRLAMGIATRVVNVKTSDIWSEEGRKLILEADPAKERLFLLANRRGLAPLVVCDDCGEAILCNNCGSPLVLHQVRVRQDKPETTVFRCHHCGETRTSEEKCRYCESWRLRALGTGIERVAKEVKILVPDRPLFQIDTDQVKTAHTARAVVKKFLVTPGAILLGTEMALNYLHEKVAKTLVVTIDAMLALPDFRINERVFTLLARLRVLTTKDLIIQTRQTENETLDQVARGQLLDFYRHEIAEREKFDYPPFRVFVKISRSGPSQTLRAEFKKLSDQFKNFSPIIYPGFHQPGRGLLLLNLLIKLKPEQWPNAELAEALRALPPSYLVTVDPENIL